MATTSKNRNRVLIVLSDAALATAVHRVIDRAGFQPVVVADPADARDLLENGLEPCVLLFALTSAAAGREFIRAHVADLSTAAIPVIFFTPPPACDDGTGRSPIVAAMVAFVQAYCDRAHSSRQRGSSALPRRPA